jgi:hypothetical protein
MPHRLCYCSSIFITIQKQGTHKAQYCPTILAWHFINFRKGHLTKHWPVSIKYIYIVANFTRQWGVVYWYRCRTTDLKVYGSVLSLYTPLWFFLIYSQEFIWNSFTTPSVRKPFKWCFYTQSYIFLFYNSIIFFITVSFNGSFCDIMKSFMR